MDEHDGHRLVIASGRLDGEVIGWRVCVDCTAIIGPVAFCLAPTKRKKPCRIAVRPEHGFERCPAHRKAS